MKDLSDLYHKAKVEEAVLGGEGLTGSKVGKQMEQYPEVSDKKVNLGWDD